MTTNATTITRPTGRNLQPALQEFADNRRFATPVAPYRRGFEDATYDRVYANAYQPGTPAALEYQRGCEDAELARYQARGVLLASESARMGVLLERRGLTAEIERVSLTTGASRRLTIGAVR